MNIEIEEKLNFERIRELIKAECVCEQGRAFVDKMQFMTSFSGIREKLLQTEEFRQILVMEQGFPSQDYLDLTNELIRLRIEGTRIELEALFDMRCSLKTIFDCLHFLQNREDEKYPQLRLVAEKVSVDESILRYCNRLVDDKGKIYDNASPLLASLRKEIEQKKISIDRRIAKILVSVKKEGWTNSDSEITIRNGHVVIPIADTHRRKIKGFIHDESSTRQTAYIEPAEIVELNNELRELEFAERREIDRILLEFTDFIRPHIDSLLPAYRFLGIIDFIRAKARFALTIKAGLPLVYNKPLIYWFDARHPLLYLSLQKQRKEIVPLKIELNEKQRIVIISGPNAGGKSVCLKTVGLLQYMLQCGLLVSARETSEFGIFHNMFIDIGDQQSIENDLSTYSSHLLNMKELIETANNSTLFLIDEMGSGTEPKVGGAIAESVLEMLNEKKSFGVVTTHYANLKLLADHEEGIANAAMLFDTENMRPLYQLSIGKPGSSFAFEIAQKIGLPEILLQKAIEKTGSHLLNFETQLQQIESEKINLAKKQQELQVADDFLSEMVQKYTRLSDDLENKKEEIILKAKAEAKNLIASANRAIENTISEIKKSAAEKESTQKLRQELTQFAEKLKVDKEAAETAASLFETPKQKKNKASKQKNLKKEQEEIYLETPIEVGDIVQVGNEKNFAEVIAVKGKKAELMNNSIKMEFPLSLLKKTAKKTIPVNKTDVSTSFSPSVFSTLNVDKANFSPKLDIRGKRVEEALELLQKLIDKAILLNEKELIILHGKGNGILRQVVREVLRSNSDVETFYSEHIERGGDGITIVRLR